MLATIANRGTLQRLALKTRRAGRALGEAAALTATTRATAELGEELEIAFRPGLAERDPDRYLDYALELELDAGG